MSDLQSFNTSYILISSRGKTAILGKEIEKDDVESCEYFSFVSKNPLYVIISVSKDSFISKLIRFSGVFSVNFLPNEMNEEFLFCKKHSGEFIDKSKKAGIALLECETIECSYVRGTQAHLECELEKEFSAGENLVFLARVSLISERKD